MEDKDSLRTLIKAQYHSLMSPEISQELDVSRNRGDKSAAMQVQTRVGANVSEDPRDLAPVIMDED